MEVPKEWNIQEFIYSRYFWMHLSPFASTDSQNWTIPEVRSFGALNMCFFSSAVHSWRSFHFSPILGSRFFGETHPGTLQCVKFAVGTLCRHNVFCHHGPTKNSRSSGHCFRKVRNELSSIESPRLLQRPYVKQEIYRKKFQWSIPKPWQAE